MLAGSIAFPDVSLVVSDFVVERMVDGDGSPSSLVDPVHMVLELDHESGSKILIVKDAIP
jgi:hypothetical protein